MADEPTAPDEHLPDLIASARFHRCRADVSLEKAYAAPGEPGSNATLHATLALAHATLAQTYEQAVMRESLDRDMAQALGKGCPDVNCLLPGDHTGPHADREASW